jgi:uncharacterized protein (DUF433 family)
MSSMISIESNNQAPWMRRLTLPAYQVKEVARYAGITPQTILNWQKNQPGMTPTISRRDDGKALSYLQLIEIAVVASLRSAGVSLAAIKEAKEYIGQRLHSEYPFAEYGFKTDGSNILMNLSAFENGGAKDTLVVVNRGGQLGWKPILERRLKEFEYRKGKAVKWNLGDAISINPQVSFGAPSINGIPTWTIKGRLEAGESIEEIAYDFSLKASEIKKALEFEGVDTTKITNIAEWSH